METTLSPYLIFSGACREAMQFYQSILGGELMMHTYGAAGQTDVPEQNDKIIHGHLTNGAISLMASDDAPGQHAVFGNNIHLSLNGSDAARLTECFQKLAEGGTIVVPLEKQFWGDVFGMLTDRFGIRWMVNISSAGQ